jgi:hypothetical protein
MECGTLPGAEKHEHAIFNLFNVADRRKEWKKKFCRPSGYAKTYFTPRKMNEASCNQNLFPLDAAP